MSYNRICPKCRSPRLGRSRTRNLRERFSKLIGNRPYRCVHCGWRGQVKDRLGVAKGIFGFIFVVLVIIWVAFSAYYVYMDSALSHKENEMKKIMEKPNPGPASLPPLKK